MEEEEGSGGRSSQASLGSGGEGLEVMAAGGGRRNELRFGVGGVVYIRGEEGDKDGWILIERLKKVTGGFLKFQTTENRQPLVLLVSKI